MNREKDLLVRMCSVCKSIQIPERGDVWYSLEDYLKRAHIPHTLSQSVCRPVPVLPTTMGSLFVFHVKRLDGFALALVRC